MKKQITRLNPKKETLNQAKQIAETKAVSGYIKLFGIFSLILMGIIILIPYAKNQLWLDDLFNSEIWGITHRFDMSVFSFAYLTFKTNIQMGRMLLGYFYIDTIFYFVRSVRVFRLLSCILFVINIGLFSLILYRLKAGFQFIIIFLVCLLALLRITPYYDPIAAFGCFFEAFGIMLCVSVLLLLKWYNGEGAKYLYLSGVILFFSLLWYEINLIFYPIALYFVYTNKPERKNLFKNIIITLAPVVIFFTIDILIKLMATIPYDGTSIGSMDMFLLTYFKQLFAVVPGSYYWLIGSDTYPLPALLGSVLNNPLAWLLFLCTAISLTVFLVYYLPSSKMINNNILVLGLLILIFAPVLIAMSSRYQNELIWGNGYLPVYYQYFGLAILLAVLILKISRKNKLISIIITLTVSIFVILNWTLNMFISQDTDARYWSKPSLIQQAHETGFLAPIQDGDIVNIETMSESVNGNLIYELTGKKVSVPDEKRTAGTPELTITPRFNPQHFFLHAVNYGEKPYWKLDLVSP